MTCVKDPDADLDKTSNRGQSQTAEREVDMNTLSYGKDAFKDYIPLKFRDGALLERGRTITSCASVLRKELLETSMLVCSSLRQI